MSCLPAHLQEEKIEIVFKDVRSTVIGRKVTQVSCEDQVLGDGVSWRQPQVELTEPPVLTEDALNQSMEIQTTEQNGHSILMITEMDDHIVDHRRTVHSHHEIRSVGIYDWCLSYGYAVSQWRMKLYHGSVLYV